MAEARSDDPGGVVRDLILGVARRDCLMWAIREPGVLERFRRETGNAWTPGATAIERMIDESCGAPEKFAEAFIEWFDANIWGDPDAEATDGS